MKIYSILGVQIADVPVQSNAEHERELMKSDFIRLEWSQSSFLELPCGSYIEYDGVKYRLLKDYKPEQQNTQQWDYSPEFQHPVMMLGTIPFILVTGDTTSWRSADKETEWSWTGMAVNIINEVFIPFLNSYGTDNTDIGTGWTAVISTDTKASETLTFQSMDFLSALSHAAQQYECEWHLDYENKILYFGHINITTEELVFEVGENVGNPEVRENNEGYYNAYIAKGSTRNISQVNDKGENIQLNKRLKLDPAKYPDGYIDRRKSAEEPLIVKELIYEDIYPSLDLYIYNPKARTRFLLDSNTGEKIEDDTDPTGYKRYSIWYVRLAYKLNDEWKDFEFSKDMLIGNLSCQFQANENSAKYTSPLAGLEFELTYHDSELTIPADPVTGDTGITIRKGDYEIIYDENNGLIIPTTVEGGMYPRGDEYQSEDNNILRLYNIALPSEYTSKAQEELETQALKDIVYWESDRNNYEFSSNPIAFKSDMPKLFIGRGVVYKNGDYQLNTRISKLVQKIDFPYEIEITVGNEEIKGSTTSMREQLQMIVSAMSNGMGGISVEQFKKMLNVYALPILNSRYLSKINDDTAAGFITFLKGLVADGLITAKQGVEFGEFISGYIGKGGKIDANGHGELESLTLRSFLAVPVLRYNRVSVTDGESWNTNGYGVIEEVDTENKIITLHLEDDEYASVEQGDICRGIFQDLDNEYSTADADADDCGFATKKGFFTSYFTVVRLISRDKGECRFEYALRNESTPQPCRMMKFAQYGSFTNEQRMSSCYSSAIVHFYSQVMEHVNTWEISPMMMSLRFGWLEGFSVTLKNGNVVRLKDHGLYVPGNVYFGQTITQLDAASIADLKKQLEQYTIEMATAVDVITVDDAGNVIGGLYSLDAGGKKTDYRLSSAVFVKRGNEYLMEADKGADASSGTYRIYAYCDGCECVVDNSTIYITSIKNIKDGIAGTEDDLTFDYDAMRKMTGLTVTVVADCEGIGSISKDYHVTVKHDPKPFINFTMDNQIANISYNTKTQKYVGSPYKIRVSAYKDNAKLPIVVMNGDAEVRIMSVKLSSYEGVSDWGVSYSWDKENNDVVLNVSVSSSNATSGKLLFTASYNYAGVSYEQSMVHSINIASDTNMYELMPSVSQVMAKTNQSGELVADTDKITCKVICNSSDDGQYVMTADELTTRKMSVKYSVGDDATLSEFPADGLSVSAEWSKIVFHLFFGDVEIDTQDVPVMLNGLDGEGYECVFILGKKETAPDIIFDADSEDYQKPDYLPTSTTAETEPKGQWTDNSLGIGANWPYEFYAIRRKKFGKWQAFETPKIWSRYAVDGENPYIIDLTNENSSVLCDDLGNALSEYEKTSLVIWRGTTNVTSEFAVSINNDGITCTETDTGYTYSFSNITKDLASVTFTATNGSVTLVAVYTVARVRNGAVYSLVCSRSTVHLSADGTPTDSSNITVSVKRTTPSGTEDATTAMELKDWGLTLQYLNNNGGYVTCDGAFSFAYSDVFVTRGYASFRVIDGNNAVVDSERINAVSDGNSITGTKVTYKVGASGTEEPSGEWEDNSPETTDSTPYLWRRMEVTYLKGEPTISIACIGKKGDSAVEYSLVPNMSSISIDGQDNVQAAGNLIVTLNKTTGGTTSTSTDHLIHVYAIHTDGTKSIVGPSSGFLPPCSLDISDSSTLVDMSAYYFEVINNSVVLASLSVPIMRDGKPSFSLVDRGLWSPEGSYSYKYENGILVRDMVKYPIDGIYYYYMVANRTDLTGTDEPVTGSDKSPSNTDYWEQGSKYNLLVADVVYADNATLGGFRINQESLWAGGNTPNDATILLDGKNKRVKVTGEVNATSGSFDNCTINETCEVGGRLKGVTGTFRRLTSLDENGDGATSLVFGDGRLVIDGHIDQQGTTPDGNSLRFYSSHIWCRGSFGAYQLNTVIVEGNTAKYHYDGLNKNDKYYEYNMESVIINDKTCYKLPLYSPGTGIMVAGFPVDMVLFRNSNSAQYYMFTDAVAGKMVHCINITDDYNNTFILGNSGYTQCSGGVAQTWFYAGGSNIKPANANNGGGWLIMTQYDNNW